jgi:hypothetical protein
MMTDTGFDLTEENNDDLKQAVKWMEDNKIDFYKANRMTCVDGSEDEDNED